MNTPKALIWKRNFEKEYEKEKRGRELEKEQKGGEGEHAEQLHHKRSKNLSTWYSLSSYSYLVPQLRSPLLGADPLNPLSSQSLALLLRCIVYI